MSNNPNQLTQNSQSLRKNMTREEKHLWYDFLKYLPVSVNRQRKIKEYIVDFYISSARLVIEIDGSQHFEPDAKEKDAKRDADLRAMGIKVLRYTNIDLRSIFVGVCMYIYKNIEERT